MTRTESPSGIGPIRIASSGRKEGEGAIFFRQMVAFVLIGLGIYAALYAVAEVLVREHAFRNRFHVVQSAGAEPYDFVILGASHAAVFDYRDMNARLEEMTGARILNLANVGAGVTVNRLLLDYFLEKHSTEAVVYVLDSFGFYSPAWNEERLKDASLYVRAPFDPVLAGMMICRPGARAAAPGFISGFTKINDPDRFEPDLFDAEGSTFDRTYRPIPQLDRQRIEYLYPDVPEDPLLDNGYLREFEAMIVAVREAGIRFVIIRPPVPQRIYEMIPFEAEFDARIRDLAQRTGAELHDFSSRANEPENFYDSDHLNETGVLRFFRDYLADALRPGADMTDRVTVQTNVGR